MLTAVKAFLGMTVLGAALVAPVQAASLKPNGFMSSAARETIVLKADFDGDGHMDDVWLSPDEDGSRLGVYIRLNRAGGSTEYRVTAIDADLAAQVQHAPASAYKRDCGDFASACEADALTLAHDGLIVSLDEGVNVLVHWSPEGFQQDFIASDEVRLRRAVATLFNA